MKPGDEVTLIGRLEYKRICGKQLAFLGLRTSAKSSEEIPCVLEEAHLVKEVARVAVKAFVELSGEVREYQKRLEVSVLSVNVLPSLEWHDREEESKKEKTEGLEVGISEERNFVLQHSRDLLPLIFENVALDELRACACVNKLWRELATKQQEKRGKVVAVDLEEDLYNGFQACRNFYLVDCKGNMVEEEVSVFPDRMENLKILVHLCKLSRMRYDCRSKFRCRIPVEMYSHLEKNRDISDIAYDLSVRTQFEQRRVEYYDRLLLIFMEKVLLYLSNLEAKDLPLIRKVGYAMHNTPGSESINYGPKASVKALGQEGLPLDPDLELIGQVIFGRDCFWEEGE